MKKDLIEAICGSGRGKTTMGIGLSLRAALEDKSVIIIQFLKGKERQQLDFLQELENLNIKIFRFEKMDSCYQDLSEQQKLDEQRNIINGLHYARKVVATGECDFLFLDEILGLLDVGIATEETIEEILRLKDENMHIVMTGRECPKRLREFTGSVTTVMTEDYDSDEV